MSSLCHHFVIKKLADEKKKRKSHHSNKLMTVLMTCKLLIDSLYHQIINFITNFKL